MKMKPILSELLTWAGAISIIAAAWCLDYRFGMLCLGIVLTLAGIGITAKKE